MPHTEIGSKNRRKGFLLGLLIGLVLVPAVLFVYLGFGNLPVAASDTPFPFEARIVKLPLKARVHREMQTSVPIEASASNLEGGAHIYRQQCAACHGLQGLPSDYGLEMYPKAPQLWEKSRHDIIGVSDDPPGETYWKVANGIRLTGMPAFQHVLTETQMWQVSLLLANADKSQPAAVMNPLKEPLNLDAAIH